MELSEVVKSNQLQQKPTGGALTGFTEAFTVKAQWEIMPYGVN